MISARLQAELWTNAKQSLRFSVNGGRDLFTQKNKVVAPPGLYALEGVALPGSSVLSYAQNTNRNVNSYLVHDYHLSNGGLATGQIGMQLESVDLDANYTLTQGLIGGLTNVDRGLAVRVEQNRVRSVIRASLARRSCSCSTRGCFSPAVFGLTAAPTTRNRTNCSGTRRRQFPTGSRT